MPALSSDLRRALEDACVRGRRASEEGCRAELGRLGVLEAKAPSHLTAEERHLRRGLRAKRRQLGDEDESIELLLSECAYEQWHRLLFARFLAENGLLIHPAYRAPVTLAECAELAPELGEPDGWGVAARFAAEILPGIFRLDDPCVRLRLAPESRLALEAIVEALPSEIFTSDDGLGWVYQYWQREKKDEVNASERKIGGADLGPVTQLFTENYMVRFLLENSLGAWWAARHPESPLLTEWEYLRFDEEGRPAAGTFEGWPEHVAEVTVMDPCCGSGHFLVEAFGMLWRMRVEEEGLSAIQAQDAVLEDNLFGLELDPRCVQIAMFAVALAAWKAGGGWREVPVPHIACSGIPVKTPVGEWTALANGDPRLEQALEALHVLFRDADTLGSLIDPRRAVETAAGEQVSFDDVHWDEISSLLEKALSREVADPVTAVLGADARGIVRAAQLLSRVFTLATTNVPYLLATKQTRTLADYCARELPSGTRDLATAFLVRLVGLVSPRGSYALVSPQSWLTLGTYEELRRRLLQTESLSVIARLGTGAFESISGDVVNVLLGVLTSSVPAAGHSYFALDCQRSAGASAKAKALKHEPVARVDQASQLARPLARILGEDYVSSELLGEYVDSYQGICLGDSPRFRQAFWEGPLTDGWLLQQNSVDSDSPYAGREFKMLWESGEGQFMRYVTERLGADRVGTWVRGLDAWGARGIAVSNTGEMRSTLYGGDPFQHNLAVLIPRDQADTAAIWCFALSTEFKRGIRDIDTALKVENSVFRQLPFEMERWRAVATERYPDGLPAPWSDDPTQWLFEGRPEVATEPLQVAVGRLLGYRWPEQPESDDLDKLADPDGIVCLPSVLGERPAAERLQELLARAYGATWSPTRTRELLAASGSKKTDLDAWLRDEFFKAHCQVFKNRPFVWHIWDGRKDGFSALVNYHRLDKGTLRRLTYTYLGDWIERQEAANREGRAGAEARLVAARDLQRRLALVLEGEPPYDIFVRWKSLAEQPLGWDPDLNDGVRLNARPFVEAGVLRAKFNVNWKKDRGKNPDGSERHNDLHYTLAAKRAARAEGEP